jgi:hypothetical protein
MEKELLLREGDELCCPYCGGAVRLNSISVHFPTDGMVFTIETDPLRMGVIDSGGGDPAWLMLGVSCPKCEHARQGDDLLIMRDGDVRADHFVVRARWGNE